MIINSLQINFNETIKLKKEKKTVITHPLNFDSSNISLRIKEVNKYLLDPHSLFFLKRLLIKIKKSK